MFRGPRPARWPTKRSRVLDVSLAVGSAAVDGLALWFLTLDSFWAPRGVAAVAAFLVGLALVVRRRHPVALAGLTIVAGVGLGSGLTSGLIALYSLGAYAASRRAVTCLAAVAITGFTLQPEPGLSHDEPLLLRLVVAAVFVAPPVLLGLYMGTRKQLIASLQERTRRLERERTLLAERARVEERARIAREMHDVVANRVSVMVVHASALRAIVARDPERAAETAAVIGDMGRQALEELRQVIGVLRLGEDSGPQATPTLADLRELVDQSGAAGLKVCLTTEIEDGALPPEVARTVYRVIQEALTNVHKHAGDADTHVLIRQTPDVIEMSVENAPADAEPGHALPGGGNGLVGLRERVTALGGSLQAGPRPGGGFAVHARIPLPVTS
ncbi:Signal transduction histidine kinase [Thermomonospora echinospora]|uniref:histidine kinase n=1 Tax=Thermomonospora echinospora TaxID=1992 RepID=A0A1H5SUB9_9ACTN|nr:histidine kinase [Thermomonospora echinospora]SEF54176.1 Signal transduction histidine kinase [Thermomonospora echinospora]